MELNSLVSPQLLKGALTSLGRGNSRGLALLAHGKIKATARENY